MTMLGAFHLTRLSPKIILCTKSMARHFMILKMIGRGLIELMEGMISSVALSFLTKLLLASKLQSTKKDGLSILLKIFAAFAVMLTMDAEY